MSQDKVDRTVVTLVVDAAVKNAFRLDYLTRFHTTRHVSRGSVDRSVRRSPSIW